MVRQTQQWIIVLGIPELPIDSSLRRGSLLGSLSSTGGCSIVRPVKLVRSLVALMLLAVWPAVTSHTLLEQLELVHVAHADHDADLPDSPEHDGADHDAADGLCLVSSKATSIPVPQVALAPELIGWLATGYLSELQGQRHWSGTAPPGTAPPELLHCWQFSSRAALSARAPSFLS